MSRVERRARELYLTEKGRSIVERTRDVVLRQDDEFFAALDGREREQLLGLLRKVYEAYLDMAAGLIAGREDEITQPDDIGRIVAFALDLPNTASVAEIPVNWALEENV